MRAKRNQPNDLKTYDRRSNDLLRNAEVAAIEVACPIDQNGATLVVMRSIRNDPLARLHAHHQINEAQYQGGRAFQEDFETAERGPQAIDPSKEYVDGGRMPEPITEAQRKAVVSLNRAGRILGQEGSGLIHGVLIAGKTLDWICREREMSGERERRYLARRLQECLNSLSVFYGFAMAPNLTGPANQVHMGTIK